MQEDFRISINIHYVFSTKGQQPLIVGNLKEQLWAFVGDIAREHRMKPLGIGGTADHIHIFISMPTTISIAEALRFFKDESVQWVRETYPALASFAWQEGDLAVGLSESVIEATVRSIIRQEEFHLRTTFKEEYVGLLRENGIEYDVEGLWD
jgi:putative transposase